MKPSIEEIEFHGIAALRLNGPRGASAVVSKLGAQVLSWVTPDGRERLFLSDKAVFDGSVAIRGGIPVCWPQFAGLGELPKHGFVRTLPWQVSAQRGGDDYALLTLEVADDATTRALWPHAFHLELTVMLEADRLDLELSVNNTGDSAFAFTGALVSISSTGSGTAAFSFTGATVTAGVISAWLSSLLFSAVSCNLSVRLLIPLPIRTA